MVMRWHYALAGLLVTVVLGVGFNRYVSHRLPDLGHLNHIDTSGFQEATPYDNMAFELYVDFDTSMKTESYRSHITNNSLDQLLAYFRAMYSKTNFFHAKPQSTLKIPRIFHYIWLGKKLPREYLPYLESWKKHNPDWTFIYWVDNPENYDLGSEMSHMNFEQLTQALADNTLPGNEVVLDVKNINFDNRKYFDEATNYGEKSDILKWEVVYRFGGTYIDVDQECLRPFEMLHHMYDFYAGIQPLDTQLVQLGAGIFGAVPGHPILGNCVNTIKADRNKPQIVIRTGPIHFTKSFLAEAGGHKTIDVALPASYFYPCDYEQRGQPRSVWHRPESFAVHHWFGSWLTPDAEKKS